MPLKTLLLASSSPRRRQLLALGGWTFNTMGSDIDESQLPGEAPAAYVLRLAEAKARSLIGGSRGEEIIIGSDTSVVDGEDILGKPADAEEAAWMLRRLRGHTHQVYTGLAALRLGDGALLTDVCVTDVPMRDYSDEEIQAYVSTGDPFDKAGGYAIQHPQFQPVQDMRGCHPSVMGLPLCRLTSLLAQLGVPPASDITARCGEYLDDPCPVYTAILRGEGSGQYQGEE